MIWDGVRGLGSLAVGTNREPIWPGANYDSRGTEFQVC